MAPVTITLIGDFYRGLEKTKAMGALSSALAIGGVAAPLIGGSLADINWKLPFLIYSLSIPLAVVVWAWLPSPEKGITTSLREYLRPIKSSLSNVRTLAILFSNFLTFFLLYTIVTYVPLLLSREYGASGTIAGALLAAQGAAVALVAMQSDSIVKSITQTGAICLGFLIAGISLFFVPSGLPLALVILPLGIFGAGRGFIQPQINTVVTDVAPEGRLGGLVAIYNFMKYAGQMSAPLILGWLLAIADFSAVFQISGILSLIAFALILKECISEERKNHPAGLKRE